MYDENKNSERPKDKLLTFKSTRVGKSSTGSDRLELSMNQEEVKSLIAELTANAENPNGVKIDIHTKKKVNGNTGLEFDSSFAFVKAIGERPGFGGNKTYKPKAAPAVNATAASVIRNATLKTS